jgi:3-hydroxyacyl-CoA dehydrogenase
VTQQINDKISVTREDGVLVVLIDNPPINAGSLAVRQGIFEAVRLLAAEDDLRAAVLVGGSKTFIAGSDLREFGQPLEEPQLPAVIRAIEEVPKPVVAALEGAALGGGFELALGCDARIAAPKTLVGLPEVTLGMIPGAGGTQRLPRLVGLSRAIAIVCSGERLPSAKARQLGIIDEVVEGDLRAGAVAYARAMVGKRRVRDMAVPAEPPAAVDEARASALKGARARPNVHSAIERVVAAAAEPIDAALARERELFQGYRTSADAFALRHLFFSEREAARAPGPTAEARSVQNVAVIGGGTMGSGIAICFAQAGYAVQLLEQDSPAAQACAKRLDDYWAGRVKAKRCTESEAAAARSRVKVGTDWNVLANIQLAVEAVFEDIDLKQDVFRRLDAALPAGAILASNTSYLDLDAIAGATRRPGDVLGLHFFSPAPAMKLLEVVSGRQTDGIAIATGLAVARKLGKQAVQARNGFGFIGNRIFDAYRRQCEFLLEEGALPRQVDAALEAFGFALGPFAVADLSGLDVAWRMRQARAHLRDPAARYVSIADRLCEMGRLGRKSGAGWYRYEAAEARPEVDPKVISLIESLSADKGIRRRTVTDEEIVRRAVGAMINEGLRELEDGTALRSGDIDVALVHGYGFPRWRGGPLWWARQQGEQLERILDELAAASGPGFVKGRAALLG